MKQYNWQNQVKFFELNNRDTALSLNWMLYETNHAH